MAVAASHAAMVYNTRCITTLSYLAQLCRLPRHFRCRERCAINRIFHLPGNTLPLAAALELQTFGGPKVTCSFSMNMASIFRAANKTIADWRENLDWLSTVAASSEHLPLAPFLGGTLSPPFWDSDPLVVNLRSAVHDFAGAKEHAAGLQAAFGNVVADLDSWMGNFKVQKWAYAYIRQRIYGPALLPTIQRRLVDNLCIDINDLSSFEPSSVVCKLSSHCAMCVLKTWLNAWTTSHRMHEPFIRRCIFGCPDSVDNLAHYVVCDVLWTSVGEATGVRCTTSRERLSLEPVTLDNLYNVVVAFTTYHYCKNSGAGTNYIEAKRLADEVSLAACRRFVPHTRPRSVLPPTRRAVSSNLFDISSRATTNLHTRFVQGGDHFMTTSFTS